MRRGRQAPARQPRIRQALVIVTAFVLVVGLLYWVGRYRPDGPGPQAGGSCTVEADGSVRLEAEQMANAATITAVGARMEMPDRAVAVALATALQESKLRNLPHLGPDNDHDSIGLFQQRPSQGWGAPEELRDPRYAAERFYQALREVSGWQSMRITDAAQRVQRSAYPEAYERWAGDATVLATALLGRTGGAVACELSDDSGDSGAQPAAAADTVAQHLSLDWGPAAAGAVDVAGAAVTVPAGDPTTGWRYAHWLVSHAGGLGVDRVHFTDLEWRRTTATWQEATDSTSARVVAEMG